VIQMKIALMTQEGEKGKVDVPVQFDEPIRPDLIRRAVLANKANLRQPYGTKPDAGQRQSAKLSRRRRAYRGAYGIGISRVPRKILSRRGTRMNWAAAVAPGTVKGRQAHPPKASKIWSVKINAKERRKAIRSAIAASIDKAIVALNGHRLPEKYPFIIDSSYEDLDKTKSVVDAFEKMGLTSEMERASIAKIRAGQGKLRGRRLVLKRGPVIVVSGACKLEKAAANMRGFEVVRVDRLSALCLSHDVKPGRMAFFTKKAIEKMAKERLFA
jgi:large subunit ribosomal protein L4e